MTVILYDSHISHASYVDSHGSHASHIIHTFRGKLVNLVNWSIWIKRGLLFCLIYGETQSCLLQTVSSFFPKVYRSVTYITLPFAQGKIWERCVILTMPNFKLLYAVLILLGLMASTLNCKALSQRSSHFRFLLSQAGGASTTTSSPGPSPRSKWRSEKPLAKAAKWLQKIR